MMYHPMLATTYKPEYITKWPMIVQPKLDGMRVIIVKENNEVIFLSRTGKLFYALMWMKEIVLNFVKSDCILDCEVTSNSFNDIVSIGRKKYTQALDAKINIFDVIRPEKLETRLEWLFNHLRVCENFSLVLSSDVSSYEQIESEYKFWRSIGYEGIMIKDPKAIYLPGRNRFTMKLKDSVTYDLPIVDITIGTGKISGMMGALVLKKDNIFVNCGTGFSNEQRKWFWENKANLIGIIVEINAQEETKDGSLRHPRFKKLRLDK